MRGLILSITTYQYKCTSAILQPSSLAPKIHSNTQIYDGWLPLAYAAYSIDILVHTVPVCMPCPISHFIVHSVSSSVKTCIVCVFVCLFVRCHVNSFHLIRSLSVGSPPLAAHSSLCLCGALTFAHTLAVCLQQRPNCARQAIESFCVLRVSVVILF